MTTSQRNKEIPTAPRHHTEMLSEIHRRLKMLEEEYGFDPHMNLNDIDTNAWNRDKERAYGAYTTLLTFREWK